MRLAARGRHRELHAQSKPGGCHLRQLGDRRSPERAGQGRRVCRCRHGPNPHLHGVLRLRAAVRSRSNTRLEKGLLGGWQLAGITRIESGPAARIQVANCNFDGWCITVRCGPTRSATRRLAIRTVCSGSTRQRSCHRPAREYGTAPVAPFRLPGRHQWDFTVSKTVSLGGTRRLQFRADLINAFNQTQFLDVNTMFRFGTTTCDYPSPGFGQVTSTRPPREIQLGVRLNW